MHSFYSNLWKHFYFLVLLVFSLGSIQDNGGIKYFDESTVAFDWGAELDTIALLDSIAEQTIYKVSNVEGQPLYYYQNVSTNVCFDNKCRPIRLKVYWNITGRYWGYTVDGEEFLSRRDHDPFKVVDYERLHVLLADAFLPFGNVTFEELIEQSVADVEQVDGVTGATSKQLSAYVVEGAAYTTYVLWHVIYGSAREMIRTETSIELSPALLSKILCSSSSGDKIWGLSKIDSSVSLEEAVEKDVLKIISGEDFFASFSAIGALSEQHLKSVSLQEGLFATYRNADNNLRNQIFEKFMIVPELSSAVLQGALEILPDQNGVQLGRWLELFNLHGISDNRTCMVVAGILEHENSFVSKKAYQFLSGLELEDEFINRALDEYTEGKN